jgi:protocatechuate 3,4-dioxygenase, beta subunit
MSGASSPLAKIASGARPVAARLERTPHLILGPFYPIHAQPRSCSEIWSGKPRSPGEPSQVRISGRVLDTGGRPIRDALVEVWQADQHGRYRHPDRRAAQPSDPDFAGCAAQRTRALGRYCFWTLKPGAYRDGIAYRAPHLHFQVTSRHYRLVTQMFFPDESSNDLDHWY